MSLNGAAPLPAKVNLTKAAVKRSKSDWTWEDEMLMYDISNRDTLKKRRLDKKDELKEEKKRLEKEKKLEMMVLREERKIFVGNLSAETVEKDLQKHFTQFGQVLNVQASNIFFSN